MPQHSKWYTKNSKNRPFSKIYPIFNMLYEVNCHFTKIPWKFKIKLYFIITTKCLISRKKINSNFKWLQTAKCLISRKKIINFFVKIARFLKSFDCFLECGIWIVFVLNISELSLRYMPAKLLTKKEVLFPQDFLDCMYQLPI